LRALAGGEIAAEHDALAAARRRNFELERRARVPMPDLDRVDAMPVRTLAARQQKIDRGGRRTGDADAALPAPLADVEEPPVELELVNEGPEEKAEAAAPTDVGPS